VPDDHEVTGEDIIAGLRELGLRAGDKVQVHSSLGSFGHVVGGPGTVIAALQAVLTPAGTVMMPAFDQGRSYREGARGYFDPRTSPTANGAVPDLFWRQPGVFRSWQP